MPAADEGIMHCPVTWAQRKNVVLLTFCIEDCDKPQIELTSKKLFFKGIGGSENKCHENEINFYGEINTEKSQHFVRPRNIEFILIKKEEGFWPRLSEDKTKMHWLKVDFSKWKDEDDSDNDAPQDNDLSNMMRQMGGLADVDGAGDRPSFDDFDAGGGSDSDDDNLPDLE